MSLCLLTLTWFLIAQNKYFEMLLKNHLHLNIMCPDEEKTLFLTTLSQYTDRYIYGAPLQSIDVWEGLNDAFPPQCDCSFTLCDLMKYIAIQKGQLKDFSEGLTLTDTGKKKK